MQDALDPAMPFLAPILAVALAVAGGLLASWLLRRIVLEPAQALGCGGAGPAPERGMPASDRF